MTDNIIEKAKALFEQHKETPCFYFTSDGQAFQLFERAEHNASRLKDKTITDLYNPAMSEA
ncbi:MAG: hypothetical protein JST19_20535, partial [Bacteroidetes bacterium]|nr:hypothetical protein [Bacteroidota bacterium]